MTAAACINQSIAARPAELQERLIAMAQQSAWMMPALSAVRQLGLASWCIGAGAVRNLVWDALHGLPAPSTLADFDVAVRHNPARASVATYRQRMAQKRYTERWPKVTIVPSQSAKEK